MVFRFNLNGGAGLGCGLHTSSACGGLLRLIVFDGPLEDLRLDLGEVEPGIRIIRCLGNLAIQLDDSSAQVRLLYVDSARGLTEAQRAKLLLVSLVEDVGEERVNGVVLRELFLEDEHVVHVGEDSVEIGREQVRLHLFAHLSVAGLVEVLDLLLSDLGKLTVMLCLTIVDVLDVLNLE